MSPGATLAWLLATGQAALAAPFLVEMAAGLPRDRHPAVPAGEPPRFAVLMPAHDEAGQIGGILDALRSAVPPDTRCLVVADNCSDATAAIARAHGAEVIERHDPARRGKGYALAFGRDHLRRDPPAVVVVLDADCRAEPGALARLAARAQTLDAPVQGLYLLTPDRHAPAMVQVSNFAFAVKNLVRQRGLHRLGAPAPLGGTGMAFPWHLFEGAALATGDLVEDLALSVALAIEGNPARFDAAAAVWSAPASVGATAGQRARWEGGFLQTARTQGARLLAHGIRSGRPGLLWMALHVATPPLTLLLAGEIGLAAIVGALSLATGVRAILLSLAVLAALLAVVLAAWGTVGRRWLRAGTLLRLPLYLLWKLPLYARLLTGRGPRAWVRTEREP